MQSFHEAAHATILPPQNRSAACFASEYLIDHCASCMATEERANPVASAFCRLYGAFLQAVTREFLVLL
jgi:hypothetical protein